MIDQKKQNKLGKIFISLFAVILIAKSTQALLTNNPNYTNYWGGFVFAPVGIIVGCLLLYIVYKWKDVDTKSFKSNSKKNNYKKW